MTQPKAQESRTMPGPRGPMGRGMGGPRAKLDLKQQGVRPYPPSGVSDPRL